MAYLICVQRSISGVVVVKHEHVDEVNEDTGSLMRGVNVIGTPLEDDHEDQIAKQAGEEKHLRDELQDNVHPLKVAVGRSKTKVTHKLYPIF